MKIIEIGKNNYSIPTKTSEVTIKKYFEYLKVVETYQDWIEAVSNGDITIEDNEIYKEVSFMADMLVAITDIPQDVLYTKIPNSHIIKLADYILFEQNKEDEPRFSNCFEFSDCTNDEVQNLENKIKNLKWYQIHKIVYFSYQLYKIKKPVLFLVADDLREQTLSQWIVTEQFRKNMIVASEELKSGVYTNIAKIIAHITRRPNEDYDEKKAVRREKVFENLPLSLANQISNFFLLMLEQLQKNLQTYSEETETGKKNMTTTNQPKRS